MRFFINLVKEVMFFLVLILIMFFAWFFISNTFLNKNLYITKKENKEVVNKPAKKEEEVVIINKPVKKEEEVVVVNKPAKKVKRKIYRKVKKTRKTNWAERQHRNYRNGNESVFTSIN